MSKIGIFAGSFDPVHKGHVAFALQAIKAAHLDQVYFLPEVKPRGKNGVTHVAHRTAMLKHAAALSPKLRVLNLPEKQFSVPQTLPRLRQRFKNDELFLLIGSDVLAELPNWPLVESLIKNLNLIVGQRSGNKKSTAQLIAALPIPPRGLSVIVSQAPDVTSSHIRQALGRQAKVENLLSSTRRYIAEHWLYTSLPTK